MTRFAALAAALSLAAAGARAADLRAGVLKLTLDNRTGDITGLSVGAIPVPLRGPAALFHVRDVKSHSNFVPLAGPLHLDGGETILEASAPALHLTARIALHSANGVLAYRADIVDTARGERGLVVAMTLPLAPAGLTWSGDLYDSEPVEPGALYGNNTTPISTVASVHGEWAVAAAIPPTAPVTYDTHCKDGDFGLYYYIGMSAAPRDLPSRAWIEGLIYSADPRWGFRSALEKYYAAYPEFYTRRVPRTGAWCTAINAQNPAYAAGCGFYEAGGGECQHLPDLGPRMGRNTAHSVREWAELNHLAETKRLGVLVFPYTIVGQRQIFMLPGNDLYTDYTKAMSMFEKWTSDLGMTYENPANANSYDSVAELKEIIRNSGLREADGRFVLVPRIYTANTLTFPLNPNPRLFSDRADKTIARYTLEDYVPRLLKGAPEIDGFYVDSMGSWSDFTNYRRDHFVYAKYPLSVDQEGNPVLRNLLSHYEYVEEFRRRMHAMGKFVFLNGVNGGGGKRDGSTDHAASRATSRFFLAALGDFCGIESGIKTPAERMGHYRIMSGKKPYAIMAYGNKDGEDRLFPAYVRRVTAFGIFPSAGTHFYTAAAVQSPSQELHRYYLPLVQKLNEAGWEPVTGVAGVRPGILCERFGRSTSGPMYLTLFNDRAEASDLVLQMERSVLGSATSAVEIGPAGQTVLPIRQGTLSVRLEPTQLKVLQIQSR